MSNVVMFSGGKDSTAMLLRMIELNYKIDKIVFADTTLEFDEIYQWINKIDEIVFNKIGIHITKTKPKKSFDDWFYGSFSRGKNKGRIRGFPYVICGCYWNRESKINPLKKFNVKGNTIYIGIAKDEEQRTKRKQYLTKGINYKFPLVEWNWTENDCVEYLKNKGLEHPLYKRFKRTGCWLCPKQSLKSLENLYLNYPNKWKKLKQYEKDSPQGFKPNFSLEDFEKKINNKIKYCNKQLNG